MFSEILAEYGARFYLSQVAPDRRSLVSIKTFKIRQTIV